MCCLTLDWSHPVFGPVLAMRLLFVHHVSPNMSQPLLCHIRADLDDLRSHSHVKNFQNSHSNDFFVQIQPLALLKDILVKFVKLWEAFRPGVSIFPKTLVFYKV